MKKMNYKLMALALFAFAFTACEEDGLGSPGELEASMGELYVNAESTASQLFKNVDEAMRKLDNGDALPYTIDNATFDEGTNPGTYVLDYGNGTNTRGKVVKGQVNVSLTGTNYLDANSSVSISYDNYFVDDKPVTGMVTATNTSTSADTIFEMAISNLAVQDDGEEDSEGNMVYKTLTLNSDKELTWNRGANTPNTVDDDRYTISDLAGGNGTTATYDEGKFTFDVSFTTPLVIDNTCQYRLIEGVIDLDISTTEDPSPLSFTKATIDFISGDGANQDGCDKFFTIDLNNDDSGASVQDLTRQFSGF